MMYLALASTDNQSDNQPGCKIPWVDLLINLKMRWWSWLTNDNTLTVAMDPMLFWPKLLHLVANW